MKAWISKLFGGTNSDTSTSISPTQVWLDTLAPYLEEIETAQPGLGNTIAIYLATGEPISVLLAAQTVPSVGDVLRVCPAGFGQRLRFDKAHYQAFATLPAPVQWRWVQLLASCATRANRPKPFHGIEAAPWLEVLLKHSCGFPVTGWYSSDPTSALKYADFERLLSSNGIDGALLLKSAFLSPADEGYGTHNILQIVARMEDYPDVLEKYAAALAPIVSPTSVAQRLHVLTMFRRAKVSTLHHFLPTLIEMASASSKQVRLAAEGYVLPMGHDACEALRTLIEAGKPEQRLHALDLLYRIGQSLGDNALTEEAREKAARDKAPSVQALIQQWEAGLAASEEDEASHYQYTLPEIDWRVDVTPERKAVIADVWAFVNNEIVKSNERALQHHQAMLARGHNYPLRQMQIVPDNWMAPLTRYFETSSPHLAETADNPSRYNHYCWLALETLTSQPSVNAVMLYKFLRFFGLLTQNGGLQRHASQGFNRLHARTGSPSLLELAQMLEQGGDSSVMLLNAYCAGFYNVTLAQDWPESDVWPYFAHHLDDLIEALVNSTTQNYSFSRQGLFRAIATLPYPPAKVVHALFTLALGSGKTDRLPAQNALSNQTDKEARIIAALSDGKSETRMIAAQWLARIGYTPAIPALETALKKEKQDQAKAVFLDALQSLGSPIDRYLDRDALAAEAAAFLKKGMPKDLAWFPWEALPLVRWADTKAPVATDILRWMLGQAVKGKSPEPNAILQKYCNLFEKSDKDNLGQFLLETWLQEDIRPIEADEALKRATQQAQWMHGAMQRSPQYYQNDPNNGRSVEELTAIYLPGFQRLPAGSATATKGLLAVVAACAGARAAPTIGRYLKEWYGSRAAQGKALIATLAWIEHPSATQLMLSVGSRFRTKSFQEEATKQAEALAERKGWTLSELADRTIPSAGFDENGVLELSYGPRVFTARLLADYRIELFNPDGKPIKSLPEPRQDDDEELAKLAKKTFSSAKKEIKSVIDLQSTRLYEALCIERDWAFEDWQLYLNQHPLVRRLLQRLVWVHSANGQVVASFRPLDDGTLTNRDDEEVQFNPTDRIQLAHETKLSAEDIAGWQQHFVDYEITPLFPQFGKGTYGLPASLAKADKIEDFKGYLIETFALRNRALKLGYTRGQAEDGGWFYVYQKRFPTLGLEAVIEFTGNGLPEENRTVALIHLSFASSGQHNKIPLSTIPKVLLSECYGDLRTLAADGSGFDAEWEKKSAY